VNLRFARLSDSSERVMLSREGIFVASPVGFSGGQGRGWVRTGAQV
jgi:hypothetical protein